jgi:hypothetical protein
VLLIPVRAIQHVGLVFLCSRRPLEEGTPVSKHVAVWYLLWIVFCDLYFTVFYGVYLLVDVLNLVFRILTFHDQPFQYLCFDLSWLLPKNWYVATWKAISLPPLPCYSAVHLQLSQSLYLIMWSSLLSCLCNDTDSITCLHFNKINVHVFCASWDYCTLYIFIVGIL